MNILFIKMVYKNYSIYKKLNQNIKVNSGKWKKKYSIKIIYK